MPLVLFGFHGRPHDFAVTKSGAALEDCIFLLDFSRPLEKIRWLCIRNRWVGITVGLLVPVVHGGEGNGEFVISLNSGQPYFEDIPKLWRQHYGVERTIRSDQAGGLKIISDFGIHFPEDCQ